MLFGMRGGVKGSRPALRRTRQKIRANFNAMFPAWRDVETPYFWSGLISLARTLTPFAGQLSDGLYGAFNYHGNGVAMGSYAGRLIADQMLGENALPAPDFMRRPPRRFELGRWRRWSLYPIYAWYQFQDR